MKKSTAMLFNIGAMLCWSISPLLIRYVKDYYTVSFQNFYRFLVSILIVWIFTLVTVGRHRIIESIKKVEYLVPKLLAVAVCVFAHQFFVIKGVYTLMPGLVTIVEESIIIFSACLAFLFIPAERKLILQPLYIAGLFLAIGGVVLTAMPDGFNIVEASEVPVIGIVFVLISSLSWAVFSLLIRLWFPSTPSPVISSLVFTLVIPLFLVSLLIDGGTGIIMRPPSSAWILLTLSGIVGNGLGYTFYYQAIKGLGVTMTSSLGLLVPLVATLASFIIFGERLSLVQMIGTAALIGGSFLIIRKLKD